MWRCWVLFFFKPSQRVTDTWAVTALTSVKMWLRGRPAVCRSSIKQVTISTVQRPFEEKTSRSCQHAAVITAWLPPAQRSAEKPPAPRYQTSSWRRLREFHLGACLGTHRVPLLHCGHAGPPPAMPQLLLVTKVLPSICYHSGFHGSFGQTFVLAWLKTCTVSQ